MTSDVLADPTAPPQPPAPKGRGPQRRWGRQRATTRSSGIKAKRPTAARGVPATASPGPLRRVWQATAPARTLIRRSLGVITPLGWLVLGVVVIAGVLARRLGWLELWVLALAGAVALVIAVGFALGRSLYRVSVDLANKRVVVGARAMGRITVANASRGALLPARIELPVGAGLAAFRLPRLPRDGEHEELFVIPTSRRGIIVVGPVLSVRDDPLRLLRREVRWSDPEDLFVHPRTTMLDGASSGFLRDIEGLPTRDLSVSDVSFHALREYVAGDDRRSIHWKTTARTGRLMVRQYTDTRRSHLAVALSVNPADYADPEEFELAVSVAGSLALQAVREEKGVTVLTQAGVLPGGSGQRLLDGLAGVELIDGVAPLRDLARTTGATVPEASAVAFVAGSTVAADQWQRASAEVPLGALGFALACHPGTEPARRTIADFLVLAVGELGALGLVMRRVGA